MGRSEHAALVSILLLLCSGAHARDEGVKFSMRNLCGEMVRVYWIGFDGKLVPQSALPVKNSSGISINSYRTHKFAIWYHRGSEEQTMAEALQYGTKYTVGDTNDIVTIEKGLVLYRHDAWHVAQEATKQGIQMCDELAYREGGGADGGGGGDPGPNAVVSLAGDSEPGRCGTAAL